MIFNSELSTAKLPIGSTVHRSVIIGPQFLFTGRPLSTHNSQGWTNRVASFSWNEPSEKLTILGAYLKIDFGICYDL